MRIIIKRFVQPRDFLESLDASFQLRDQFGMIFGQLAGGGVLAPLEEFLPAKEKFGQ